MINDTIESTIEEYQDELDAQQIWEFLKYKIKSKTIAFGARQKRVNMDIINKKQEEIRKLEEQRNSSNESELNEIIDAKSTELKEILGQRAKGAQIRAKVDYLEFGEKSTKYFFKQEKRNYDAKTIEHLIIDGIHITEQKEILKEQHKYYQKLFTSNNINPQDG